MYRYLFRLINKFFRLLKSFLTHLIYRSLIIKTGNYKPLTIYFLLISFSTIFLVYNQSNNNFLGHFFSDLSIEDDEIIQCHFPQLSLNNDELDFTIPKLIQPKCQSWFYPIVIENFNIRLVLPDIDCDAIFYLGEGDRRYRKISIRLFYNLNIPLLSDHFTIQCVDPKKKNFYPKLPYTSIHYNPTIRQRLATIKKDDDNDDDFNLLVLGLDSISRLQFQRMLPQSYEYLIKQLNGIILKGYNILGDGTPQQLVPMLTGFKEIELPSTLVRDENASFVNIYPFVWNQYRDQGYVTGYAEDRLEYGIWSLRLKGFKQTPTDHYLSPFYYMDATKALLYRKDTHCIRNQTTFEIFLSYIDQFWLSYPMNKKFFFAFFKQYTHDGYASGSLLDLSLLNFLKKFSQTDDYRKTILILMTDHGARFSAARQTSQGKLEERLPLMSFVFPELFHKKYPQAIQILKKNIPRLTTPFDIHSTLLSLMNMKKVNYRNSHSIKQRNISLFNLIPAQRTCDDLELEAHWCTCLQWNNIDIQDIKVQEAIQHIIHFINQQLLTVKDKLCHQIELEKILNAQMYQPNRALLTFSNSLDIDGRIPKYSDNKMAMTFYQITFETKPNQAIYEATTQYSNTTRSFNTDLNHISRLNAYKSSASCIEKSYSHLRKFCDCIK